MSNILNLVLTIILSTGTVCTIVATASTEDRTEFVSYEENIDLEQNGEYEVIGPDITESTSELGVDPDPTSASTSTPQSTPQPTSQPTPITSNVTGLPDTISRYEWERQGGWKKLVEAAYLKAIKQGATPMCGDGMCQTILYYKISAVATDPCYATLEVVLEAEGKTQMHVAGADLIAAPGSSCDVMRSQIISVPPLGTLTQYLLEVDAKYGLYSTIKGASKPTPSVPARLTRPEFTAQGGWERVASTTLKNARNYLTTATGDMTGRTSVSSELCFGEVTISLETLKVIAVSWDDARTPTCDYVRNDHPPLPTVEYLNQYLFRNP